MPRKSTKLFHKYYKEWIELYKKDAVRHATLIKYELAHKHVKELCPDLHLLELPVIKITGITLRDYITYTILIVHAPNLVIMTGNTTIILKIIFTNYRTCFDSLKILRIISCY